LFAFTPFFTRTMVVSYFVINRRISRVVKEKSAERFLSS